MDVTMVDQDARLFAGGVRFHFHSLGSVSTVGNLLEERMISGLVQFFGLIKLTLGLLEIAR